MNTPEPNEICRRAAQLAAHVEMVENALADLYRSVVAPPPDSGFVAVECGVDLARRRFSVVCSTADWSERGKKDETSALPVPFFVPAGRLGVLNISALRPLGTRHTAGMTTRLLAFDIDLGKSMIA
ncbi:MAG: hypothetical protein PHI35_01440 [Victivallaceae bacterium]|nr:hypothetical protein [Victivallaceae bacterium]